MPNAAAMKMAFNAGELSPLLDGRSDLAKYASGCSILENYIPTVHGPVRRRPGTRFVADAGASAPVLVPFVFNRTQSYVLAIAGEITVYSARGVVLNEDDEPYTFGDAFWTAPPRRADGSVRISYTQSGDVLFVCDAEGGKPLMKITRRGHADWAMEYVSLEPPPVGERRKGLFHVVDEFPYLQYPSAVPITNPPPAGYYYIPYNDHTWLTPGQNGIVYFDIQGGGYSFAAWQNGATLKSHRIIHHNGRYYWNSSGIDITLDAVEPTHEVGYGEYGSPAFLLYIGTGRFYFELVQWVDVSPDPEVNSWVLYVRRIPGFDGDEVLTNIFDGDDAYSKTLNLGRYGGMAELATSPGHEIGAFPDNVAIFRDRLCLTSGRDLFLSVAGGFNDFKELDRSGNVVADAAMNLELLSGDLSPVSWMSPSERLVLGSFGGERSIGEQNISDPFGPLNARVDVSGAYGSKDIQPAIVGTDVLFVDRSGRRIRRSGLNGAPDDAADLSLLSEHLGAAAPFVDMAYQMTPGAILWLVQSTGDLVGLTYDRAQDVAAWHRHDVHGIVRSICSIPSPDGTRDDLWLAVEREVDGATVFYIEVLVDDFALGIPVEDQCFLDCSLSYSGAPVSTVSGLDHLEGETVQVLADGSVLQDRVVTDGAIALGDSYSKVHVGIGYSSTLRTMRLDMQSTDGAPLGKIGRIHKVCLRMLDSVGIRVGPALDKLDRKEFRRATVPQNGPVPISTVDLGVDFPNGYDTDNYVCILQDQPLPSTILAISVEYGVQS